MLSIKTFACMTCAGVLLLCVGCGSGTRNVTIPLWQKNIEQYVTREGGGDPAVLRDMKLPDDRRGYNMIGSDRPAESADANGVLLGFRQVNGRNWFIYLVGLVRKERVEQIRLAALTTDDGKFVWALGDADEEALRKYRDYNNRLWHLRFPQRGDPPQGYLGFPRPEDQFELALKDAQIIVVHPASGAEWELKIPAPAKSRVAAVH